MNFLVAFFFFVVGEINHRCMALGLRGALQSDLNESPVTKAVLPRRDRGQS